LAGDSRAIARAAPEAIRAGSDESPAAINISPRFGGFWLAIRARLRALRRGAYAQDPMSHPPPSIYPHGRAWRFLAGDSRAIARAAPGAMRAICVTRRH